jgi:hypothetical protein
MSMSDRQNPRADMRDLSRSEIDAVTGGAGILANIGGIRTSRMLPMPPCNPERRFR